MTYKLPEAWKQDKLSKHIKIISGGTPKRAISNYWGKDIPWISIQDIKNINGRYVRETVEGITKEGYENSSTNILKKDDIIISARGTVGELGLISMPMAFNQSCYGIRTEKTIDSIFLYYFLRNNIKSVQRKGHGSVFNTITIDTFDTIVVQIPPIKEQKAIAKTLSALDDKIENNNKIAKNLEEQAQAIFKHWFVDFEFPKEEGKPYKSSGGEMVESELGMIPKGWEIKMIKDFSPVITGKKNANIASKNGKYRFFTCSQKYSFTDNYSFEGKAVLVAGNGDFNVKFYNGKFEAYQRTYVLIPYNKDFAAFIYYMVKHNLDKIIMNARGSVISYLTKSDIENSSIAIDLENNSINEILKFFNLINNKILYLQEENQKLEELRDTLLPKLISGELRIPLD